MTAIAANAIIKIQYTPFCDRSCKGVRVVGQFLGRSLYALSLLMVSVACRIFSRDLAQMYLSMAKTQFNRSANALMTYLKFGEKLIDFSYNGCVIAPPADTEQNALRSRYGSNTIDRWLRIGTEEIPLKPEKLRRAERGICLGMTLDFMKEYLQKIQIGMSPMKAIREISSRYVNGAPDKAQIAQIFYLALDSTHVIKGEWARLDAAKERQRANTLQWIDEQQKQIHGLPRKQIFKTLAQLQTEVNKRLNSFRFNALANKIRAIARIDAQRDEIVGNQFGLQIGPPRIYAIEKISKECDPDFGRFLEELQNGCYAGGFRSKASAHAVTLIKASDNQYFLFEPSLGTLVFKRTEVAENLWNIGRSFYLKNGLCSLSFSSCRLR